MQGKVAVLGDENFVMPFTALGLDTFAVSEKAETVVETAKQILKARYMLIVVAENIAPLAQEVFEPVSDRVTPCIVTVPFTTESQGFATKSLARLLKIATGIDIIS